MIGVEVLDKLPEEVYRVSELDKDKFSIYLSMPYIERYETPNMISYKYFILFNGYLIDIISGDKTPKFTIQKFTSINETPNHFIKENQYWKRNAEDITSKQYIWISRTLHYYWNTIMGELDLDDFNPKVQINQQEPKNIIKTPYGWHSVKYDSVLNYAYSGLIYLEFSFDDIFKLQRKAISLYDEGVSTNLLDFWIMDLNSKFETSGIVNKTIKKLNGIFNK